LELKTGVCFGYNAENEMVIFAAHCCGDDEININKTGAVLGLTDCDRLPEEECIKHFGVGFGELNPFTLYIIKSNPDYGKRPNSAWDTGNQEKRIPQVFDKKGLETIKESTGLVTTNPGDMEYSIQFDPQQTVDVLANTHVVDITRERKLQKQKFSNIAILRGTYQPKSFALIGGNGPRDKAVNYVKDKVLDTLEVAFGHNNQGEIYFPKFTTSNVPSLGYSMELEKYWHVVLRNLIDEVRTIAQDPRKFELIGIPCNTLTYKFFEDEIQNALDGTGVKYVSMPQKVLERFKSSHSKKQLKGEIGIFGIGPVADMYNGWSHYSALNELDGVSVEDTRHLEQEIQKIGFRFKQGDVTGAYESSLELMRTMKSKNILVALTELSLAFEEFGFPFKRRHDSLEIYADEFTKEVTGIDPSIIQKSEQSN